MTVLISGVRGQKSSQSLTALSVQQRKALKMQPRCAIMHTTPTGNIPEAPELGTPRYSGQNFGPQRCPL